MEHLHADLVRPIAWTYVNALRGAGIVPDTFEGLTMPSPGDAVYDLSGEVLFHRVPLERADGARRAFADIAVHPALGHPFLAASEGVWSGRDAVRSAIAEARVRGVEFDSVRVVAYSYPKLAAQFLRNGDEVLMLELFTNEPVPREPARGDHPGNFQRWSLLESIGDKAETNARLYDTHVGELQSWLTRTIPTNGHMPHEGPGAALAESARLESVLARANLQVSSSLEWTQLLFSNSNELHYSLRSSDHHPCYELRGQATSVWCVAASVQMMFDFYRYGFSQDDIAAGLGLGTRTAPQGLPYGDEYKVVDQLQVCTGNALTAAQNSSPTFAQFETEIDANRPCISFIPGHSRSVAGYYWTILPFGTGPHRGLLVYDPWPPNAGVITRYENFDAQTYRDTFTAHVTLH
ncbi:MAG: hypothetical protein JOZ75_14045 [Candidatus Dormibacteraeota bacterium]|nr:hypothetical protein [Candidatus Dormibacteraeota bacterium]